MHHPRHQLFPIMPRGHARAFENQPIQIDGMEVQFDEKVALFPVHVEVIKDGESYQVRQTNASTNNNR